jgi:hypothetical protein
MPLTHAPIIRLIIKVLCCCAIAIVVSSSQRAVAADPTPLVTLQARAGFDGYFKAGGWLPVTTIVANEGPDIVGTVTLSSLSDDPSSGRYGALVNLPAHSKKQYVFAAPTLTEDRARTVTLSQGGAPVAVQTLALTPLGAQDYLYGVLSPSAGTLDVLRGLRQFGGNVSIAHLNLDDVPISGPVLDSLDALLLDDVSTNGLSAQQVQALASWVRAGGQLIVAGGPGAAKSLSGLGDLAPVRLSGTESRDVTAALGTWGLSVPGEQSVIAVSLPDQGALVRLRSGDVPLVVDRPNGRGWTTFVALSPNDPALRLSQGAKNFWQYVLTGSRTRQGKTITLTKNPGVFPSGNQVYALPETALPSWRLIVWLVFGYVLVVGPVNYVILRRIDRRELLWVTIPAVSVLFASGVYFFAWRTKGSQMIVNTISIARSFEGQTNGPIESFVGIFSAGRGEYDVRVGGDVTVAPLEIMNKDAVPLTLSDGPTVVIQGVRLGKWAISAFDVQGGTTPTAPLASSLTYSGTTLQGWVRNTGQRPLQDVFVLAGYDAVALNTLQPGAQADIHMVTHPPSAANGIASFFSSLGSSIPLEMRRRQFMLGQALGDTGSTTFPAGIAPPLNSLTVAYAPTVLAFGSAPVVQVTIQGQRPREHDLTLYVVSAPVTFQAGTLSVPYGFARREMLENGGLNPSGYYGGGFPLGTTATFQYALPPSLAGATWTSMSLRLATMTLNAGPARSPSIALFNWATGQWDAHPEILPGISAVRDPSRYIDARGLVRVQVGGGNGQLFLKELEISATGDFS